MKLTGRDCRILAALPAVVTVLVYLVVFFRPAHRQTLGLKNELAGQDPLAVREDRMTRAQADNTRLKAEFESARKLAADGITNRFDQGTSRATTLHEVSRLCEAAGLTLVASTPIGVVAPDGAAKTGTRGLLEKSGWKNVEAWRLDVRGAYGGMLRLLDSILAGNAPVVPVGVNMEPAAEDAKPIAWSVVVWM